MSNHHGPEGVAPDEQRCHAMTRAGSPTGWKWQRVPHRCPRPAQQTREGVAVCYIHAHTKTFSRWDGLTPVERQNFFDELGEIVFEEMKKTTDF